MDDDATAFSSSTLGASDNFEQVCDTITESLLTAALMLRPDPEPSPASMMVLARAIPDEAPETLDRFCFFLRDVDIADAGRTVRAYKWRSKMLTEGIHFAKPADARLFFPISRFRASWFALVAGLLAEVATHSLPISSAAGVIGAAAPLLRRLSDAEVEVFYCMQTLSAGAVYRVWLTTDQIVGALDPDQPRESHLRTLANMRSKGILEEGAGNWRAVW